MILSFYFQAYPMGEMHVAVLITVRQDIHKRHLLSFKMFIADA